MKKIISTIMILFVLSTSMLIGCKKATAEVFIKGGEIELYTYDELDLTGIAASEYSISCEESDVLSLDGTTVFAKKEGVATINVEVDGAKYYQQINVVSYGNKPEILVEDVSLILGSSCVMAPITTYKLNELDGVTYEYSIGNSSIAEVKDGKITAKALGQTTIDISASYNGVQNIAEKTIDLKVNELSGIDVANGNMSVYIKGDVDGTAFNTEALIEANVYVQGEKVDGAEIVWVIKDQEIASIKDGNTIVANKVGTTTIVGTYTGADGKKLSTKELTIEVKVPTIEIERTQLMDLGLQTQEFSGEKISGYDQSFGSVIIGETEYALENNSIQTADFVAGEYDCVFYNQDRTHGYATEIVIADFVVYEASQLIEMAEHPTEYIALANDIDYGTFKDTRSHIETRYHRNGLFVSRLKPIGKSATGTTFSGTFNGLGHTIKNIDMYGSGLFPTVSNAVMKNFAMINVKLIDYNAACLGYRLSGGKCVVDNVHLQATCANGKYEGGVFEFVYTGAILEIKNSIIDVQLSETNKTEEQIATESKYVGVLTSRLGGNAIVENVYCFSKRLQLGGQVIDDRNTNYGVINRLGCLFRNEAEYEIELGKEESIVDYSGFNSEYWDFSGNVPIFKTAK